MKANEAAKLYANTHTEWFDSEGNPNVVPAFEAGAQWADETMIEKACEWLRENAGNYEAFDPVDKTYYQDIDNLILDFKKHMKE